MNVHQLRVQPEPRSSNSSWIFSNRVQHLDDSLLDTTRSALIRTIPTNRLGIYNKNHLISVRLLANEINQELQESECTPEQLIKAIANHLARIAESKTRFSFTTKEAWRWIHGDADGIPGIVVDHYQKVVVLQSNGCAGDFLLPFVKEALEQISSLPLFEKSCGQSRQMEGLQVRNGWLRPPNPATSSLIETRLAATQLHFDIEKSQKTGLFLDQRLNLQKLTELISHNRYKSILDICSYAGAWSAQFARAGGTHFELIDQDGHALELATNNIRVNCQLEPTIITNKADLFTSLTGMRSAKRQFDVVVADPPAFARSRKHLPEARRAYGRLLKLASALVAPNGLLVVCSCSRHLEADDFVAIIKSNIGPGAWVVVGAGEQSPDHTVLLHEQGSEYLKCHFLLKREL